MACKTDPEGESLKMDRETLWRLFESVLQSCAAEFLGTMMYVFIECMVTAGVKGSGIIHQDHLSMIVPVALCAGFTVAALMASFGQVSGAHINPAVSLGVCVAGGLPPTLLIIYIFMQLLGGVVGAAISMVVTSDDLFASILKHAQVELAVSPARAVISEAMLTGLVVFVLLLTTVDERTRTHAGPTAVGFTYVVGTLAGMRTTGGCMNPAHSFGFAVVLSLYTDTVWSYQYVFWVGPTLGALVIALLYRFILFRPDKFNNKDAYQYTQLKGSQGD